MDLSVNHHIMEQILRHLSIKNQSDCRLPLSRTTKVCIFQITRIKEIEEVRMNSQGILTARSNKEFKDNCLSQTIFKKTVNL